PLESQRNKQGDILFYAGANTYTKAGQEKKSDIAINGRGQHITSLFTADMTAPFAIGDMRGTADALIFVFSNANYVEGAFSVGSVIEVFVARGYAKNRNSLYNLLADNELDAEMEALRQAAKSK
ncbi:MAG: hypothetical protein HUJ71_01840, partial [Pseudobutyrivibrio sp.]|nr:hypothetical protein [Pseudobutyrivibrio sp.]